MSVTDLITTDPEILGGVPVFKGTRVPVKTLFEYLTKDHSTGLTGFTRYLGASRNSELGLMSTIVEVEKLARDLPERERAALAANLLNSLPGILSDEDEGVAEALRRDAEIEANPTQAISLAELDSQIQGRRG